MKNSGVTENSEFWLLNQKAENGKITTGEGEKDVKYVTNFGDGSERKDYLLSAALTDTELMNGNIVVVYDPVTADVLETFYCESEFDIKSLFPTVNESFLRTNMVGSYLGDGAPAPERTISLPQFAVAWADDDEKYLELTMQGSPATELLYKKLGLEVYALLPTEEPTKYEPLLIYTEGLVETQYTAESVVENPPYSTACKTISSETAASAPLTLEKIRQNGGRLRFAIDSMVIASADYDNNAVKQMLYRQNYPTYVSVTEETLYPRDSLGNWLNKKFNPYISFGTDAGLYKISQDLQTKLDKADAKVTDFVLPNQKMELQLKLYVLKENDNGSYETEPTKDGFASRYVEDTDYDPVTVTSQPVNPYFYSSSSMDESEIALASIRDLQNLKYIFETKNKISRARLYHDIDVQQFHDKLVSVRWALIGKNQSVKDEWPAYANGDTLQVAQITYADGKDNERDGFTISGENPSGDRCYAIKNVQTAGADWDRGGIIEYAKNITVKDLDIVNPKIWKISYKANFIETNDTGNITGINVSWENSVSGGLFGVAENCTFENVHCYNDSTQIFKQEPFDVTDYAPETWVPSVMAARYISGSVAGGLVGIAVGTDDTGTTFTNCSASTQINSYYYGAMTQCVYAGGLVGIAMGNVTIKNSYAACQLSGYYSGGLVGAVAEGRFIFHGHYREVKQWVDGGYIDGWWEADYKESVKGTLTIENSFSAGHIQRQTRVGGGLIAQTNGAKVKVNNCYSATIWEILPPIAYGTFEGDTSNYYLVQNEINVPITLNTEARFNRTAGDVFSLNSKQSGVAVTEGVLESKLTGWETASRTLRWWNKDSSGVPTFVLPPDASGTGTEYKPYPFPMPSDNTEFRGDWNQDNVTEITGEFATSFSGFYCVYFKRSDDGYQRFIDATAVYELGFKFSGSDITLPGVSATIKNSVTNPEDIWWASQKADGTSLEKTAFGTGVAGMTDVSATATTVTFTGAPYYNSTYNPTKGYVGIDKFSDNSDDDQSRCLNWDYYGWYVSNGKLRIGYLTESLTGELLNSPAPDFTVSEEDFKVAVGYRSFTINKNSATLTYDEGNGYFHVVEAV